MMRDPVTTAQLAILFDGAEVIVVDARFWLDTPTQLGGRIAL